MAEHNTLQDALQDAFDLLTSTGKVLDELDYWKAELIAMSDRGEILPYVDYCHGLEEWRKESGEDDFDPYDQNPGNYI